MFFQPKGGLRAWVIRLTGMVQIILIEGDGPNMMRGIFDGHKPAFPSIGKDFMEQGLSKPSGMFLALTSILDFMDSSGIQNKF